MPALRQLVNPFGQTGSLERRGSRGSSMPFRGSRRQFEDREPTLCQAGDVAWAARRHRPAHDDKYQPRPPARHAPDPDPEGPGMGRRRCRWRCAVQDEPAERLAAAGRARAVCRYRLCRLAPEMTLYPECAPVPRWCMRQAAGDSGHPEACVATCGPAIRHVRSRTCAGRNASNAAVTPARIAKVASRISPGPTSIAGRWSRCPRRSSRCGIPQGILPRTDRRNVEKLYSLQFAPKALQKQSTADCSRPSCVSCMSGNLTSNASLAMISKCNQTLVGWHAIC